MKAIIVLLLVLPALLAYNNQECSSLCYSLYPNKSPETQQQFVQMNTCLDTCEEQSSASQRFLNNCADACPQTQEMKSIYECMQNCRGLQSFNLESSSNTTWSYGCAFYSAGSGCAGTPLLPNVQNTTNSTCFLLPVSITNQAATAATTGTIKENFFQSVAFTRAGSKKPYTYGTAISFFPAPAAGAANCTGTSINAIALTSNTSKTCGSIVFTINTGTPVVNFQYNCTITYGNLQVISIALLCFLMLFLF